MKNHRKSRRAWPTYIVDTKGVILKMRIICPPHTRLQDHLLSQGIHILTACGGRGNCGKCVVKVIRGNAAINTMDRLWFKGDQLQQGYRLGCQVYAKNEALEVEIG